MRDSRPEDVSRRSFIKSASVAAAATTGLGYFTTAGAAEADAIKIGLIGCGGRGGGAVKNCIDSSPNIKLTVVADIFPDRANNLAKRYKLEEGQVFVGWDAYKKLLATDVDVVLLCTPPGFRPEHFTACVAAGKHVFMEKPVCVDPWGYQEVMKGYEEAKRRNLSVVAGTCWRHHDGIKETHKKVMDGAIGDIVSGCAYYCTGQLWHRKKQPGQTEMEFQLRDWVNWCWLSGDHITEQHVHNLDTIHMFLGTPEAAMGFGAKHRRPSGDQYDFFCVDFAFKNGVHVNSQCRQIKGCDGNVSDLIQGTKGQAIVKSGFYINDLKGNKVWKAGGRSTLAHAYVEEHAVLIKSIRSGQKPAVNDAKNIAETSLMCVMGRESAYTGKKIKWADFIKSDQKIGPKVLSFDAKMPPAVIPVPGK